MENDNVSRLVRWNWLALVLIAMLTAVALFALSTGGASPSQPEESCEWHWRADGGGVTVGEPPHAHRAQVWCQPNGKGTRCTFTAECR